MKKFYKSKHDDSLGEDSILLARIVALSFIGFLVLLFIISAIVRAIFSSDDKEVALVEESVNKIDVVLAEKITKQEYIPKVNIFGYTEANRSTDVSVETMGKVVDIFVKEGDFVEEGQILASLDKEIKQANLIKAKASFVSASSSYESLKTLKQENYRSENELLAASANLAAAKFALAMAQDDFDNADIKAPFAGFIEKKYINKGNYLDTNSPTFKISDLSPIHVKTHVSAKQMLSLQKNQIIPVKLINGQEVEGSIYFLSSEADMRTRTYPITIEIENENYDIKAGEIAYVDIKLSKTYAHKISLGSVVINDNGNYGVRGVDESGKVSFYELSLLSDDINGTWVLGLPDEINIITRGANYVNDGTYVAFKYTEDGELMGYVKEKQLQDDLATSSADKES